MKRTFTASITHEADWFVAQCLEVDIASQGDTEEDALRYLGEALALYFTPPSPPRSPIYGRSRSRSVPPRPLPYREV